MWISSWGPRCDIKWRWGRFYGRRLLTITLFVICIVRCSSVTIRFLNSTRFLRKVSPVPRLNSPANYLIGLHGHIKKVKHGSYHPSIPNSAPKALKMVWKVCCWLFNLVHSHIESVADLPWYLALSVKKWHEAHQQAQASHLCSSYCNHIIISFV